MTATATVIENFEKTIRENSVKKVGDAATILKQIEVVKTAVPLVYEEDEIVVFLKRRATALAVLFDNFLVAKLSGQYPLLDEKIFGLQRHLYVKNNVIVDDRTAKAKVRGLHIQTPLFVHAPVQTKTVVVGKYRHGIQRMGYLSTRTITLSAPVPTLPLEVAELGQKAFGSFHNMVADSYNNPITSGLYSEKASPRLEVMWIPTVESFKVEVDTTNIPTPQHYDPALLLKVMDRYYLVGLWDIKDELPFENILREFTVGTVQFPKRSLRKV
jgi:hypothetical protein